MAMSRSGARAWRSAGAGAGGGCVAALGGGDDGVPRTLRRWRRQNRTGRATATAGRLPRDWRKTATVEAASWDHAAAQHRTAWRDA